jgi:hypothetical protein
MADPISIAASITAVLQLAGTVIQYLNGVKGAPKERQRILNEVSSVSGVLFLLQDHAEQAREGDSWLLTLKSLNVPDGPFEQLEAALERLASQLAPVDGWKKAGKSFAWPFQKEEFKDILSTIERQKSLFSLAIQNDHMCVLNRMHSQVTKAYNAQGIIPSH